ncbi:endonuclease/exonuclease/phosphatase family protein [Planctomycetota bacterium]
MIEAQSTADPVKIVSWNIERGYHPDETCAFLRELEADIYLLTEVDRGNRRTARVDMFERLRRSLGLAGHFAVEFTELESIWRRIIPKGGPGGGVHGNAVFSRLPMSEYRCVPLPTNDRLRWDGSTIVPELFEPRRGHRVAQLFEVQFGEGRMTVVNTHLENWRSDAEDRQTQLAAALRDVRGAEIVLAGDLNPLDGILKTLWPLRRVNREVPALRGYLASCGLVDPFADTDYTSYSLGSRAKLDWICVSPGLRVEGKWNLRTALSDHNCLVVEVSHV